MSNEFLKSLFVKPPLVLNRRLLPFSAFHLSAMILTGNPYIVGGKPEIEDLVLAVHICRSKFRDGGNVISPSGPELLRIQKWGHDCDFEHESDQFGQYLIDHFDFPEIGVEEGKGAPKESGQPAPFALVTSVLTHLRGISEDVAWDMPLSRLVSYKYAIGEAHDAWTIRTERQKELGRMAAQMAAEANAGESTKPEDES